jgi:2-polyprenyl-3-methyl-5-hydroxy-6-metoxy-1,4-benzoquinol methylase
MFPQTTIHSCPLCGGPVIVRYANLHKVYKIHLYGVQQSLSILECLACGVAFTSPQLAYDDLKNYFNEEYGAFHKRERSGLWNKFQSFVKRQTLNQFFGYASKKWWRFIFYPFRIALTYYPSKVKNGRLLDIGCGAGNFLIEAQKIGWEVYGIDPSPLAVKAAKSQGLRNIYQGFIPEADLKNNFFDAVIMFHVFEHVPNPEAVLREVYRILKPGGTAIISVPNFGSPASKIYGRYWSGLSFPLHYFHYRRNSLTRVLKQNGFVTYSVSYSNLASDFLVSSPGNIFSIFYDYKLPHILRSMFQFWYRIWDIFDHLVGNMIAHFFRIGAQITVVAKKRQ